MTEIVYFHLFGAVQHERSLADLARVADAARRLGSDLPPTGYVRGYPRHEMNEWAALLDDAAIEALRRSA